MLRELRRDEVDQVWTIDRAEVIDQVYYVEDGELVLRPEHYDMEGWPPGEPAIYAPILQACYDRGGWFLGAFADGELVGVAVLDSRFIGKSRDRLQLAFLHVSHDYRGRGLGRLLFERAVGRALELGARQVYISATPSENTVDFYRHLGCEVADAVDEALFELEPEDIHMVYRIRSTGEQLEGSRGW
ncbi:MAG: GNAT family N-acetyltransferase [Anaerolineae bacterium]|jgi:predicted N-acetyltransferase YhbS